MSMLSCTHPSIFVWSCSRLLLLLLPPWAEQKQQGKRPVHCETLRLHLRQCNGPLLYCHSLTLTHTHTCGRYCTCWLCYLAVQVLTGGHRPAAVLSWGRVLTVVIHRHLQEDILQSVSITLSSAGCEDDRDLVSRKYAQSTLPLWSSTIQRCDCGAVPEVRAGSNWEG